MINATPKTQRAPDCHAKPTLQTLEDPIWLLPWCFPAFPKPRKVLVTHVGANSPFHLCELLASPTTEHPVVVQEVCLHARVRGGHGGELPLRGGAPNQGVARHPDSHFCARLILAPG
jgi:hypothetical protein